jgi:hypothetical protein
MTHHLTILLLGSAGRSLDMAGSSAANEAKTWLHA